MNRFSPVTQRIIKDINSVLDNLKGDVEEYRFVPCSWDDFKIFLNEGGERKVESGFTVKYDQWEEPPSILIFARTDQNGVPIGFLDKAMAFAWVSKTINNPLKFIAFSLGYIKFPEPPTIEPDMKLQIRGARMPFLIIEVNYKGQSHLAAARKIRKTLLRGAGTIKVGLLINYFERQRGTWTVEVFRYLDRNNLNGVGLHLPDDEAVNLSREIKLINIALKELPPGEVCTTYRQSDKPYKVWPVEECDPYIPLTMFDIFSTTYVDAVARPELCRPEAVFRLKSEVFHRLWNGFDPA